jgi:hydrogenase-4 component E
MIHLTQIITASATAVFGITIIMNLVRKNRSLISFYVLDSVLVALVLTAMGLEEGAVGLIITGILTLVVKGIMAPIFLMRIVKKSGAHFSAATYLNMPMTLLVISSITVLIRQGIMPHLALSANPALLSLLFAGIFISFFFIVNRRGALTEIVGILALENSIVLMSAFLGVSHSVALELAIAFDAAVWIIVAWVFLNMIYAHYHDIENVSMAHLKED